MFQIGQADPDRQLTGKPLVPTRPFQWWHIDFSLPTEAINKFLRLITKWTEAFGAQDQTTDISTKVFYREIVCRYGVPEDLHAVQGKNLKAKLLDVHRQIPKETLDKSLKHDFSVLV
jgi:hypothetical protein